VHCSGQYSHFIVPTKFTLLFTYQYYMYSSNMFRCQCTIVREHGMPSLKSTIGSKPQVAYVACYPEDGALAPKHVGAIYVIFIMWIVVCIWLVQEIDYIESMFSYKLRCCYHETTSMFSMLYRPCLALGKYGEHTLVGCWLKAILSYRSILLAVYCLHCVIRSSVTRQDQ
jgi:hypothetical protein